MLQTGSTATHTVELMAVCELPPRLSAGLRRASDDPDETQDVEGHAGESAVMSEEQRQYLRWFYRTEDRKCCRY